MAGQAPIKDTEDEKPLDPAVENVRRKMVRFFAINIGILMIALMAVLGAVVYKATRPAAPSGEVITGEIRLEPGERILSQAVGDGRLSLLVESANGERAIIIIDTQDGRVIARHSIVSGD